MSFPPNFPTPASKMKEMRNARAKEEKKEIDNNRKLFLYNLRQKESLNQNFAKS